MSGVKRGDIAVMSALSFVALELQTTHLDPASVSQAAYVKLVNGNITRVASWKIIPPTATSAQASDPKAKTWADALSQLNMMVGQLPIVSYYRDADKEVFQAASRVIGETAPNLHWLDCRELARTFLPELPEFQLSTVLKALDLFGEYGDSDTVEQTTQIVIELARREGVTTVEELWGDLYEQPDQLLGLHTGFEGIGFMDQPDEPQESPADTPQEPTEPAADELDGDNDQAGDIDIQAPLEDDIPVDAEPEETLEEPTAEPAEPDAADRAEELTGVEEAPGPLDEEVNGPEERGEEMEQGESAAIHEPIAAETPTEADDASAQAPVLASADELLAGEDNDPPELEEPVEETPEEPIDRPKFLDSDSEVLPVATATATEVADEPETELTNDDGADEPVAPPEPLNAPLVETSDTTPMAEAVEIPQRSAKDYRTKRSSKALRTFGFLGIFAFGVLALVGLVLTVMAGLLFFTDNALMLEAKIAGVILTGAVTLLSVLMTTISYQSFRNN
ncbi:hypothetical protein GCM10009720_20560 [Yaniella flava]|uniref:Uncharacterized protein n=2 Tax=Yaniella flava TaxID=287930 RepID=A0ABP5G4S7_9MICC